MSKAAEQMFLSQPSISLLVQSLEKDLDTRLFERQGPKIWLTTEGRTLLDLALPLVEGLETLPESFRERCGNQVTGSLNIAAGESTTLYLLPSVVNRFAELYPQIPVNLHNATGTDSLALLRSGTVDFAVGPVLQVPEDILFRPLFSFETMLITPLRHPLADRRKVTLQDIEPYPLIMPPRTMSTRALIDIVFLQHRVSYKVQMEAGGWEVIKKYVEMGLGISIVTSLCLTGNEKLAKIPLRDHFPERTFGLILRRAKSISPAARKFIELLGSDAAAGAGELRLPAPWPSPAKGKGRGKEGETSRASGFTSDSIK